MLNTAANGHINVHTAIAMGRRLPSTDYDAQNRQQAHNDSRGGLSSVTHGATVGFGGGVVTGPDLRY